MPVHFSTEQAYRAWCTAHKLGPQLAGLSPEERTKKPNKWHAERVFYDGTWFASGAEKDRYCELRILEKGGLIRDLLSHPKFTFVVKDLKLWTYTADFQYLDCQSGLRIVEDVKNPANAKSQDFVRNCLMMVVCFNIVVTVIVKEKRSHARTR